MGTTLIGRVCHATSLLAVPSTHHGALYRNNRNGTFTDVTRGSGLDVEMLGMGAAVGDYDNDGKSDLYVTTYGRNYLFHNESTPERPCLGT
jgi:hypothetical protein